MLSWMETKLQWDPRQDVIKLRRQFLNGYYGPAAAVAIGKVYDAIENGVRSTVNGRQWPTDGTGLHSTSAAETSPQRGAELLRPFIAGSRNHIDAALIASETTPEPFRSRITRDMYTLLGKSAPGF